MISMKEAMRRPYDALQGVADDTTSGSLARNSFGAGGLILLALGIALFVWMYPELQRYLRIRRM